MLLGLSQRKVFWKQVAPFQSCTWSSMLIGIATTWFIPWVWINLHASRTSRTWRWKWWIAISRLSILHVWEERGQNKSNIVINWELIDGNTREWNVDNTNTRTNFDATGHESGCLWKQQTLTSKIVGKGHLYCFIVSYPCIWGKTHYDVHHQFSQHNKHI